MALHGDCGENGKIQAAFDLYDIKYTGADPLGSALAMDKAITKHMFLANGIKTPGYHVLKSDKDSFDCDYESEFLMIEDTKKFVTQQNYFYPCELFYRYACEIYKLLEREAAKINLPLDENYRYVAVDAFLLSVAELHRSEIDLYKSQIRDGGSEHDQA